MKLSIIRIVLATFLVVSSTSVIGGDTNLHPRPFWGSFSGVANFDFTTGACINFPGSGAPFETVTDTEGYMTHMGNSVQATSHCASWPVPIFALGGWAVFVAANGDEVWAEYEAVTKIPGPIIVQEAVYTIVGGTGRFSGATGELDGLIEITYLGEGIPNWPIEMAFSGTITY